MPGHRDSDKVRSVAAAMRQLNVEELGRLHDLLAQDSVPIERPGGRLAFDEAPSFERMFPAARRVKHW
jgi:hypothetical protein